MKRNLLSSFLIAALVIVVGCAPAPQEPDTEAMIAAANALDEAFVKAFNEGDAEALSSLYWNSPDVVSCPPDTMIVTGMAALRDANARMFSVMQGAKLELTETHQLPAGDVVLGWGLWHMTMTMPDAEDMELSGRYTDVKAMRDGKWVYLMDHGSMPMPPPPPMEMEMEMEPSMN